MGQSALCWSLFVALIAVAAPAPGEIAPKDAAVFFDFRRGLDDLAQPGRRLELHGAKLTDEGRLEFNDPLQYAQVKPEDMAAVARRLDGITAMSVGGWFQARRDGEQMFFYRGLPRIAPRQP